MASSPESMPLPATLEPPPSEQRGDDDVLTELQSKPSVAPSPMQKVLGKQLASMFDSALVQPPKPSTDEPVQVFLRLRPLPDGEKSAIEVREDRASVRATAPYPLNQRKEFRDPRDYSFTKVMDESTTQGVMFDETSDGIVSSFKQEGKSGLIFTYGVTNAGKSYTVLGSKEEPGILPQALGKIFEGLDSNNQDRLSLSYMEIYNEQIFDLLDTKTSFSEPVASSASAFSFSFSAGTAPEKPRRNLPIRDRGGRVIVDGLSKRTVASAAEAMAILESGSENRQTCNNNLNAVSSRSHSVCTLELVRGGGGSAEGAADGTTNPLRGPGSKEAEPATLWIVDLAGSERGDRTGVGGMSKKQAEANAINTSLFTLMTCLASLRDNSNGGASGGGKKAPSAMSAGRYRESKLTRLLAPHLSGTIAGPGGAGRTCMIVCANPAESDYSETCHVMSQAAPCTKIKIREAGTAGGAPGQSRQGYLLAAAQKFDENGRRIRQAATGAAKAMVTKGGGKKRSASAREGGGDHGAGGRRARLDSHDSVGSSSVGQGGGGRGALRRANSQCSMGSEEDSTLGCSLGSSFEAMEALRRENDGLRQQLAEALKQVEAVEMEVREECAEEMDALMQQFSSQASSTQQQPTGGADAAGDKAAEEESRGGEEGHSEGVSCTAPKEGGGSGSAQRGLHLLASARKRKAREEVERMVDDLQERCDDLEDELTLARAQNKALAARLAAARGEGQPAGARGGAGAEVGAAAAAGCGVGGDSPGSEAGGPPVPPERWVMLDFLAALLSCPAEVDTEALEAEAEGLGRALRAAAHSPLRAAAGALEEAAQRLAHGSPREGEAVHGGCGGGGGPLPQPSAADTVAAALREALFPEGVAATAARDALVSDLRAAREAAARLEEAAAARDAEEAAKESEAAAHAEAEVKAKMRREAAAKAKGARASRAAEEAVKELKEAKELMAAAAAHEEEAAKEMEAAAAKAAQALSTAEREAPTARNEPEPEPEQEPEQEIESVSEQGSELLDQSGDSAVDSISLDEEEEEPSDVGEDGDEPRDQVAELPPPPPKAALATLDPNSPRCKEGGAQKKKAASSSKYSPGVVGRTNLRIREQAEKKRAKAAGGDKKKARIFSPRRTRSSILGTARANMLL